jgi:hypothetical protein
LSDASQGLRKSRAQQQRILSSAGLNVAISAVAHNLFLIHRLPMLIVLGARRCLEHWEPQRAIKSIRTILPAAKRFYERKRRQRRALLAVKALAHKLARARFYVLRDQVPFAPERLFV